MPTRQFTQGAFDGVALMHALLKGLSALFDATLLQKLVVFADNERAMLLAGRHALRPQGAGLTTTVAPFETVEDLDAARLLAEFQPAAVAARVARRAAGTPVSDFYRERFDLASDLRLAGAGPINVQPSWAARCNRGPEM